MELFEPEQLDRARPEAPRAEAAPRGPHDTAARGADGISRSIEPQ